MTCYEGRLNGQGMRIAVACSRFNDFITERLLAGARDGLNRLGVDEASVAVAWAPGRLRASTRRPAAGGESVSSTP